MLPLTLLILCAADAGSIDAGAAFEAKNPSTWTLSAKLGKDSTAREALLKMWTAPSRDKAEKALTRAEAEALLDDPRAQNIYAEKTISIVAPSMVVRQRQQHIDLLKIFLQPERIAAGADFYRAHQPMLEAQLGKHHVDPAVVVSILMWESKLGTLTGDFFAFNAFTSQTYFIDEADAAAQRAPGEKKYFDPKKQPERVATIRDRAAKNLNALVRGCAARGIDPLSVKGSWAGALGYPQFMPASLRWAEDGDGDGKIDLYTFDDSIASIARYLEEHGFAKDRNAAVWAYNHEAAYVSGVLGFADALTARLTADAGSAAPAPAQAQTPAK